MDQRVKAFIVLGTISVIIYTIYLMTSNSESSFLETVGGRNAANQKLMIVDQGTGEISFVKKSLTGINQNFTKEDNEIKDALKLILGNNLKGNSSGFIKELKDFQNSTAATKTDMSGHNTRLNALETFMNQFLGNNSNTGKQMRDALFNKIDDGAKIYMISNTDAGGLIQNSCGWPGGNNCTVKIGTGSNNVVPSKKGDPRGTGFTIRRQT